MVNKLYLQRVSELYDITSISFIEDFCCYRITEKKRFFKESFYLFLCNDFSKDYSQEEVLEQITNREQNDAIRRGNSYICTISQNERMQQDSILFNGKSFCHFIYVDIKNKKVSYEKDFYYSGSNKVKKLLDLYHICYEMNDGEI